MGEMMETVRASADEGRYSRELADRWFRTLDQREIDVGSRRWTARVVGIHLDGKEAWIQIAGGQRRERSLVLHLSGWTTIDQVVAAMKTRSVEHNPYPRIISVLPTA